MLVRVIVDEFFREDLAELIPVNEIRGKGMLRVLGKAQEQLERNPDTSPADRADKPPIPEEDIRRMHARYIKGESR